MLDELVDGVRTSTELRSRLRSLYSRSDVVWLAAGGLSAESGITHRAVQSALWRSGLQSEAENQRARVVVMDWTTADAFNADGLAFGAVVLQRSLPPSHVTRNSVTLERITYDLAAQAQRLSQDDVLLQVDA